MVIRIADGLARRLLRAGWKIPVVLFALFLAVFVLLQTADLPFTVGRFHEVAHGGTMLDLTWNYGPHQAYDMLAGYGPEGRHYYDYELTVVDVPFPLLYGSAICGMLLLTAQAAFPANRKVRILALLPMAAAAADYAENVGILTMLLHYPGEWRGVAAVTNLFTLTKNVLVIASLGLLTAQAVILMLMKLKRVPSRT